ncbi:hypothetical protein QUG92_15260 [Curtobacterium sp. RHCKG23]|uniref:Glycosyltransferase RgtA/B/C/D-like domain-containing protein n=1 Tax=Curtobacterium citri TaxID=3055139 RepID=A0ABT7TA72_9MICO|nr:hypothetical protein [Curtobacterium citri]MDM7886467.1 hypothetical protein [Curtobacterium citri]
MRRAARWTADRPLLGLAVLIGVLLPVTVAALSGNLAIPHNDGWAYSRIAETFGRTGRVELVGWNRSTLLGQVVPLGPLARSIVAQQLFIAVCSLVFLTSVHELLLPRLGAARAGVATIVVALWPGYALLSTSFMGDIPALALAGVTVLVGTRALERDSPWLFVVAMLIGLWGCTVRLQAIAAPAAVALAFLLATRRSAPRRVVRTRPVLVLGVAVGLTAVFALYLVWFSHLPNSDPAEFGLRRHALVETASQAARGYFELALVGAPAALLFARPWQWRWRGATAIVVVVGVGLWSLHRNGAGRFFLPNYLSSGGAYADAVPPGRVVFAPEVWQVVAVVSIVAGALLAACWAERARTPLRLPVLTSYTVFAVVGTLLVFATPQQSYGRYLIAVLPFVLAGCLLPGARRRAEAGDRAVRSPRLTPRRLPRALTTLTAACLTVVVGTLSVGITLNAFSYDIARWRAGERAVAAGFPASRVDAGFEWVGMHAAGGVVNRDAFEPGWGFEAKFSDTPACVVATDATPRQMQRYRPGNRWTVREQVPYATWLVAGQRQFVVYETHETGCP